MRNHERTNKYLAGYFDGNGCCTIVYRKKKLASGYRWYSELLFELSGWLDMPKLEETFLDLFDHYTYGTLNRKHNVGANKNTSMLVWRACNNDAKSLYYRFKKHCVIKGKHIDRMIAQWEEHRDKLKDYTDEDIEKLKENCRWSRDFTGPIKPKKHPSWSWLAGYTDSDGTILYKPDQMVLAFHCHIRDRAGVDLISKAFGRPVYASKSLKDKQQVLNRNLFSKHNPTFANKLLVPLIPHLRLKRWQAEQIMAYYNKKRKSMTAETE